MSVKQLSSIYRGIRILATGVGVAKLIALLITPLLSRLYTPENFGSYSLFIAILALLAPFRSLEYLEGILLPKRDLSAFHILTVSSLCLFLTTGILWAISGIYSEKIFDLLSNVDLARYWYLIPIAYLGSGIYEILSRWAARMRNYSLISKTVVRRNIVANGSKLLFGMIGALSSGLLLGHCLLQLGGVASLLSCYRAAFKKYIRLISLRKLVLFGKIYKDLPLYRIPSNLMLVFLVQSPILFFSVFFGATDTGQLGLALTVVAVPAALVLETTRKAYYAETAVLGSMAADNIYKITVSVSLRMFMLSLVPALVLIAYGHGLFSFVFGSQWGDAGTYAALMTVSLVAKFSAGSVIDALTVFKHQKVYFYLSSLGAILAVSAFSIAYYLNLNSFETILTYSVVMALYHGVSLISVLRVIIKHSQGTVA